MQEVILLKLGEIVLKGLNRRTFEDRLLKNIRRRLQKAGAFDVRSMQSTVYVTPENEDADLDGAEERLSKIFGVVGIARACAAEKNMDDILAAAPEYLAEALSAADEVLVEEVLKGKLKFTDIAGVLRKVLAKFSSQKLVELDEVLCIDERSRKYTYSIIGAR